MPAKSYGRYSSYTLKHCLEDDGFYVTNGEFRVPCSPPVTSQKNRKEQNWTFKLRPCTRGAEVARTHSEATGAHYKNPQKPITVLSRTYHRPEYGLESSLESNARDTRARAHDPKKNRYSHERRSCGPTPSSLPVRHPRPRKPLCGHLARLRLRAG